MTDDAPAIVPELGVTDIDRSLDFWTGLLGFAVEYERPDEGFAYLRHGSAHLMLDRLNVGRSWITGDLEPPLGRGMNLEISLDSIAPALEALTEAGWPFYLPVEEKWYRAGDHELGVRQIAIQDPDGYLVRLSESLGSRPGP